MKIYIEELEEIILTVIDNHKFPDGCLDLSGDELESFAEDLSINIIEFLNTYED
jgi:hypothetical protein